MVVQPLMENRVSLHAKMDRKYAIKSFSGKFHFLKN